MSSARAKMLLQLVSRLPLIAKVALLHVLHLSPQSQYLDLRSDLIVAVLRSFLAPQKPMSITQTQKILNRDPGIKGRIWIAKYTSPVPPETSVRDVVVGAVGSMYPAGADGSTASLQGVSWPDAIPVEAEWTGYRKNATPSSKLPPILELEKYGEMMREVTSPTTVLYFHGGAYYLMDPATHRPTTKKIAKLTGGRCYSVRYRLAPQNPFPAALIDALQSYLTLLHPPKGAFHEPVKPENVVFAGDSAGGNLAMALTQVLLEFQRTSTKVHWHGEETTIPLPAGVALSSPWLDMTHSSPSVKANAIYDYLPELDQGTASDPRPACPAWPASPPRKVLYCADALITHPLVTLLTARDWAGCPPVYMSTGWEMLADEDKYMAAQLHAQGVPIVWEEFEGMPHCFAMVLGDNPMSRRCFEAWAAFMKTVVEKGSGGVDSAFRTVKARSLAEEARDPAKLAPYTEKEMWERLRKLVSPRPVGDVAAKL